MSLFHERIALDRKSDIPLFLQIRRSIERLIDEKTVAPGERIPGDVALARLLNVHHRTVRRALTDLVECGRIVRRRRAGTFVADPSLRTRSTIGFFYFAENEEAMLWRAQEMQRLLQPLGYDLKTVGYDADWFETIDLAARVRAMHLAGALVVPLQGAACRNALVAVRDMGFPLVLFGNRYHEDLGIPNVSGNDPQALQAILTRLWDLGHRRIGLMLWNADDPNALETYFSGFLQTHGAPRTAGWVLRYQKDEAIARQPKILTAVKRWLRMRNGPTVIVLQDSVTSGEVLALLHTCGVQVPRTMSLFALFGGERDVVCRPAIGTMVLAPRMMAAAAVGLLLARMFPANNPSALPGGLRVDWIMTERESLAPAIGAPPSA